MKMLGFLSEDAVTLELAASSKEDAIRELVKVVVASGEIDTKDENAIVEAVLRREERGSTGLGDGIAIPHVKDCELVDGLTGAFARVAEPVPFDAVDGRPVDLMFLILGGTGTTDEHIGILRKLAQLRLNEHFLRFLRDSTSKAELVDTIKEMAGSVA